MLSSMCPLMIMSFVGIWMGKGSKIVDMNFSDIDRQSDEEQTQSQEEISLY